MIPHMINPFDDDAIKNIITYYELAVTSKGNQNAFED